MILPTLVLVAVVGAGISLFGLVLVAVTSPRAYRNGYTAGTRDAALRHHPSNVRVLPRQRGGVA